MSVVPTMFWVCSTLSNGIFSFKYLPFGHSNSGMTAFYTPWEEKLIICYYLRFLFSTENLGT